MTSTHVTVETPDRDAAEAFLHEMYSLEIDPPEPGQRFGLHFTAKALDTASVIRTRFAMRFGLHAVEPMPQTIIGSLRSGEVSYRIGTHDNRWRAGDVFVAVDAGCSWSSTVRDCDLDSVAFDPAAFASVAQTADGAPVAVTGYRPTSARAAGLWLATAEHARRMTAQPDLTPLVATNTAQLLAATALAVFPNNALLESTIEDRHDACPDTLRRAIAHIEAHPDEPLSVVDVAAAARVSPRAVQLAFRRHLDTTPMAYLRRVRLEGAHADLVAADPTTTTVAAVAARWGFGNPGRFAAYYASEYGRSPGTTLGRGGAS